MVKRNIAGDLVYIQTARVDILEAIILEFRLLWVSANLQNPLFLYGVLERDFENFRHTLI